MAGTLHPDKEFERFSVAKDKLGHYFRFKPRSVLFNVIWMGIVPAGIFYLAYGTEGYFSTHDRFRKAPVLQRDYVPISKRNAKVETQDEE